MSCLMLEGSFFTLCYLRTRDNASTKFRGVCFVCCLFAQLLTIFGYGAMLCTLDNFYFVHVYFAAMF